MDLLGGETVLERQLEAEDKVQLWECTINMDEARTSAETEDDAYRANQRRHRMACCFCRRPGEKTANQFCRGDCPRRFRRESAGSFTTFLHGFFCFERNPAFGPRADLLQ